MNCSSCGAPLAGGAFCGHCGTPVTPDVTTAAPETAGQPPMPPYDAPMPGQPMPGQPMPPYGAPMPSQPMPGQPPMPPYGAPMPSQPMPGQPMPPYGAPMPSQPPMPPYGAPMPGQPPMPPYGAPMGYPGYAQPTRSPSLGLVYAFAFLALFLCPPVFGGLAMYFAKKAERAGNPNAGTAFIVSLVATAIGVVVGVIVATHH